MKHTKMAIAILALVLVSSGTMPPASADVDVSFGFFHASLAPHGTWHVSASYGRVWQPAVHVASWNPYYDGRWEYSDCGWTWVADYAWGAIPYHYGTWVFDPALGWVWVPGTVWAPSWVVFRTAPGYVGWAPVAPSFTVGLAVARYEPDLFVFVEERDFLAPRIRSHVVPLERKRRLLPATTLVNNIRIENGVVVNPGPDIARIERATKVKIKPRPIERVAKFAPAPHASREDLGVPRARGTRSLRAAEPVAPERSGEQAGTKANKVKSKAKKRET